MARKDIVDRIGRLARAVANADRKRDDPGVEKWAIRLADASTSLAVLVNPDLAEPDEELFDVPEEYFVDVGEGSTVYLLGGSPNNPNGVSFTFSQAKAWWALVFADGLNIGRVRSSLTPGSKVLSPEGVKAARALGVTSLIYAPEDFNPLGLEVIA